MRIINGNIRGMKLGSIKIFYKKYIFSFDMSIVKVNSEIVNASKITGFFHKNVLGKFVKK